MNFLSFSSQAQNGCYCIDIKTSRAPEGQLYYVAKCYDTLGKYKLMHNTYLTPKAAETNTKRLQRIYKPCLFYPNGKLILPSLD